MATSPEPGRLRAWRWITTHWAVWPAAAFGISRLAVALVAYLAVGLVPAATSPPPYHLRGADNVLLDVFGSRWDTGFYVSIVEEGYRYQEVPLPSIAFFPMLPILMAASTPLLGDPVRAGILIANLALLVAACLLYRLAADSGEEGIAERATWYLLIFPASFFGSAIYTESLFLGCAIGALLLARRGRWIWAGWLGVAAALTRLHGILVTPLLLGEWWVRYRGAPVEERPPLRGLLGAMMSPLGTLGFMGYCALRFGNPLAFADAASQWGREPKPPLHTLAEAVQTPPDGWWRGLLSGRIHFDNTIDLAFVVVFLLLGCVLLAERRWGEGLFVVLGVSLSFGSGLLMSQRRYMWVLFPVFLLLARWGRRSSVDRLVTAVSLALLALFTALFSRGYWVG